ncbi:MAG: septum formation protein Maf [Chromatiales bacterium]|nr:septum formation protein Maf [Chromatiales bacterium]
MPVLPPVVLASSSVYRRRLLARVLEEFCCRSPGVDETPMPGEGPGELALRLARAKAAAVSGLEPGAVVIGSDQVATLGDRALGKPGDERRAIEQLAACSGRSVVFLTAVTVLGPRGEVVLEHLDRTETVFRQLEPAELERYVLREQPLDSAGSFKIEGLGITLFDAVNSTDPTALEGLPLISVTRALRGLGFQLP